MNLAKNARDLNKRILNTIQSKYLHKLYPCLISIGFFILFLLPLSGKAQPYFREDLVEVSGNLVDETSGEKVPYAHIINMRVRGGTISDAHGFFSVQADPLDTLLIKALGYTDKKLTVADYLSNKDTVNWIKLSPVRYLIREVDVEGNMPKVNMDGIPQGKKVTTPVEYRSDDYSEKPHWTRAIFQPISFLHYKLSKREKTKRKTLNLIMDQRQWEMFSLVYNKDIIERITGLKDQPLDDFMVYCNAFHGLHYSASSYEVQVRISELFEQYKKEKGLNLE